MTRKHQTESIEMWVGASQSAIQDLGPEIEGVQLWGDKTTRAFRQRLLAWYDSEKRDLPWRRQCQPYAIWVSEIMLQQTQVDTVIPYYARFMNNFPSIAALAAASEDDLLKTWEGLGYYSRVRNMQHAAQQIMTEFKGQFPENLADIRALKGIGPYTAGAIASIAFNQVTPAIDGNAMRVYARLFAVTADIAQAKNHKIFEAIGQYLIDPERPGDFNQAIMDLGSSFCRAKNPLPNLSPVREFSLTTLNGTTAHYPFKSKKKKAKPVYYQALLIENSQGQFLIEKRRNSQLLANMWMVPMLEQSSAPDNKSQQLDLMALNTDIEQTFEINDPWSDLVAETQENYQINPIFMKKELGQVKHIFSHLIWHVQLYYARVRPADEQKMTNDSSGDGSRDMAWVYLHELDNYAFPTVQKKIWQVLKNQLSDLT